MNRLGLSATAAAALAILTACGAEASSSSENFPSEDLRIIVPYPPGGGTDIAARGIAPCLEEKFGVGVVVENKDGGSGAVGTQHLLAQPADGHTLEVLLTSSIVVAPLAADVGYTLDDFAGVGQVAEYPYLLIVKADSPYSSIEDLLQAAEQDPGSIQAAGPGATSQGTIELQRISEAGAKMTIVPFDGTAGVKAALIGGNVDVGIAVVDDDIVQQVKDGTLRVLASAGDKQLDYLPDVPLVSEVAGYDDLDEGTSYIGLVAKAGTPPEIAAELESTVGECLQDSAVIERVGQDFVSNEFVNGGQLMDLYGQQSEVYAELVAR